MSWTRLSSGRLLGLRKAGYPGLLSSQVSRAGVEDQEAPGMPGEVLRSLWGQWGPQDGSASGHRGQWCPRCSHRGEAAEKGVKPDLSFQLPRVLLREFTVLPAAEGPGPRDRRPLGGFSGDGAL
ncbi:unnamed protein product [Rangifer tarandus platyrhynchus]|uniref:Uncharacterized protein n=1 Tax=Rangifer tarandus platyrhynchus TaxID=3082113 RepID=A0AC59YEV1_RANTA